MTYKNNQHWHFIFFLNSLHPKKLTQKFSQFLELYQNSIEINKNYYYFTFLKKKNKNGSSGRLLLLPPFARPSRTRGPVVHGRARPCSQPIRARSWPSNTRPSQPAPTLALSLLPLTNEAAPPIIPRLPLFLWPGHDGTVTGRRLRYR
jgi:hypothetical protein